MDFDFTEDQQVLLAALDAATLRFRDMAIYDRLSTFAYSSALDDVLVEGGFLDAAATEGMTALDAALIVERIASLPYVVEVAASALVRPHVGMSLPRPFALLRHPLDGPQRFLPVARTGLIEVDGALLALDLSASTIEPLSTIFAYPYGKFVQLPELTAGRPLGQGARDAVRLWGRIALSAEIAGALRAAIDFTVKHVKDRVLFGRQLGTYQAVQHRLAECEEIARALQLLVRKAAWGGDPLDAALAACFAQQHIKKIMFDLHQFNGAMGLTTEHLLHYWTFRIRALQSELGGANGAALDAAEARWAAA